MTFGESKAHRVTFLSDIVESRRKNYSEMSQQSILSSQETPSRKAAPRFTEDEKTVLIALVGEFKHIIECKKTDVASISKKNETWKEIAKRFNSNH